MDENALPHLARLGKLELGCGGNPIDGFCHNDLLPLFHVEGCGDAGLIAHVIPPASVKLLRAMHLIEHFRHDEFIQDVLPQWHAVLVPSGILEFAVPDGFALVTLWDRGDLSYNGLIRDLMGLPPEGSFAIPSRMEFEEKWRQWGWGDDLLAWFYAPLQALPFGNAYVNVHRWAWDELQLRRALTQAGFPRLYLSQQGTSIYGIAVREEG